MNRKKRRANDATTKKRRTATKNGISHETLSWPAFDWLMNRLENDFKQTLSQDHKKALSALLTSMTEMAQGKLQGRYAFGLPTGTGKTLSIIAWLRTLSTTGHDHISVAVSAAKVEALCELKRDLIAAGVPEEKIALIHSYKYAPGIHQLEGDGYASEPSSEADRQIVLVTHQRIRDGRNIETFHKHKGKERDLLLYDESLMTSDSVGISTNYLKAAFGWYQGMCDGEERFYPLFHYVQTCLSQITDTIKIMGSSEERIISLPSLTESERKHLLDLTGADGATEPLRTLLDVSRDPVRIIKNGQGGLVWYRVAVPKEMKNIMILDASHPIRELSRIDPTVKDAQDHLDLVRNIGTPLSHIKGFEDVMIRQMFLGGGRSTISKDFRGDRKRAKEIAHIIAKIPEDEAILIFTYKQRLGETVNYRNVILGELEKLGVDIHTQHNQGRNRINILTWGSETSLNGYNHCSHVILAGVMQRNPVELIAGYVGQKGNIAAPLPRSISTDLQLSESVHLIYQALSRGACRNVQNGQAQRMTGYIIHKDARIRAELDKVMPGVKWEPWDTETKGKQQSKAKRESLEIVKYLTSLQTLKVSSRGLKKALGSGLDTRSWTRAVNHALDGLPGWDKNGQSIIRTPAP